MYLAGPDDSARLLEILGPGDWFGDEALTDARIASSRAVAVSLTAVSAVPVDRLTRLLSSQPAVALELIRQLSSKLQAARDDAGRLVFDDCNVRLVKTLLHFSGSAAATRQDDGGVMLHITHRQLAQAVGAARETVSLALTQLRQQNLLRTGRNRLMFNPGTLRAFSMRESKREPIG
jgi:CRP/FNR family transcriptional regulator